MLTLAQRLATAVQFHEKGRLREAEALYRGILQEAPEHPHALHLLGVLTHQAGRHHEAIDLIHRALAVHGPHPVFHSNLGAVYLALGQLDEAVRHCQTALQLQRNLPDAYNNLGVALRRQGQLAESALAFRAVLQLNPNHVDAHGNLGAVLLKQGKRPEALAQLQETVRRAPAHAQAQNDLGGVLLTCGEAEQAAQHFREAVCLKPTFTEAHSNLGLALRDLNRIDEAMQSYREALRLNPGYAPARNNLAYAFKVQGRLPEALAEFQETLRRDPTNVMAIAGMSQLAQAGLYSFSAEEIHNVQELAARTDLPLDDLGRLHYALAGVFDKTGSTVKAFEHCCLGNQFRNEFERSRGISYDPAAHRHFVDRIIDTFTPAYFDRVKSFGLDSELPIFIVGMPRSGTTLVEQILASHPRVHGAGELQDLNRLIKTLPRRPGTAEGYPESMAGLDGETARALAEAYLQKLRQLGGESARVIDKLPFNFLYLGVIATLFPRARIIHCRRDPVDTCLSCFFQDFGDPLPFTWDLRHLGHYYRAYERLMAHWVKVFPVPLFELRYEDLTADQEATSRRLVAFCGLDWDARCLHFNDTQRVVRTASILQVRQPMYRTSVGRWKRYEAQLQPLLEVLQEGPAAPLERAERIL